MSGLRASQRLPSAPLHFIMQHQIKPPFHKTVGDVLDGGPSHRKRLGNLGFVPSVSQFQ